MRDDDGHTLIGSGFVELNPNSKIPAMYDYSPEIVSLTAARDKSASPQDAVRLFESGAMLLYLADKHGKFVPPTSQRKQRAECTSWLFWQMASAPYVGGGFGHFYNYAPVMIEYAIDRCVGAWVRECGEVSDLRAPCRVSHVDCVS